jgi:hypothetical protein
VDDGLVEAGRGGFRRPRGPAGRSVAPGRPVERDVL